MLKQLLFTTVAVSSALAAHAQCLDLSCNGNINQTNDAGQCGAIVNYPAPVVVSNSCIVTDADTFTYTGAMQTYVVPPGVTSVTIETWGAQGGANWVNNTNLGGYVAADVAVTPGSTLYVFVGGQATSTAGGFNGGGSGEGAGKGGGGGTDVRIGGMTYSDRVVVAGGGGGAGYWSSLHVVGGAGGGLTGGDGYRDPSFAANPGGKGATQSAGGADGTCVNFNVTTCAGGFGYGGSITGCGCEVYGGGGGWYGGAASGNCRGGGGGSGYAIPAATNVNMMTGVRAGNGQVVISYTSGGNPTVTQIAGLASGSLFPVGTTTNVFVADDGGNTDTCSFDVVITDNEAPAFMNMPSSIVTGNDAGVCGAAVTWSAPMGMDNCAATVTSSMNSGDNFPIGITTVYYYAIDAAGNTDTASFMVTVNDTESPTAVFPSDVTVSADSGVCVATNVNLGNVTFTDNCSATTSNDAPATFPLGVTTVNYTVTDPGGNAVTHAQLVTVVDSEAPQMAMCPEDLDMCEGMVIFTPPSATDNCGSATITQQSGPNSGDSLTAGTYTVVYVATDMAGNTDTCAFTITVHGSPAVTFTLPFSTVCVADAPYALQGASPAGGTFSGTAVTGSTFDPSVSGAGTFSIDYTYTDTNGCTATATESVIVSLCTGVNELGAQTFSMYPNPASSNFMFTSTENGTLEMFDSNGKRVYAQNVTSSQTEVNVAEFATGTYTVRFTGASGSISNGQLVITR
jgi:hypothetical protein